MAENSLEGDTFYLENGQYLKFYRIESLASSIDMRTRFSRRDFENYFNTVTDQKRLDEMGNLWKLLVSPVKTWDEIDKIRIGIEGYVTSFIQEDPSEDYTREVSLTISAYIAFAAATFFDNRYSIMDIGYTKYLNSISKARNFILNLKPTDQLHDFDIAHYQRELDDIPQIMTT